MWPPGSTARSCPPPGMPSTRSAWTRSVVVLRLAPDEAYVYDSYTTESLRGLGIASLRGRWAIAHFRELGFRRTVGWVSPQNLPAFGPARKLGYDDARPGGLRPPRAVAARVRGARRRQAAVGDARASRSCSSATSTSSGTPDASGERLAEPALEPRLAPSGQSSSRIAYQALSRFSPSRTSMCLRWMPSNDAPERLERPAGALVQRVRLELDPAAAEHVERVLELEELRLDVGAGAPGGGVQPRPADLERAVLGPEREVARRADDSLLAADRRERDLGPRLGRVESLLASRRPTPRASRAGRR